MAGLVADLAGFVAGDVEVVAGFSAALAAFLFSALTMSAVKSALSLEYRTTGT